MILRLYLFTLYLILFLSAGLFGFIVFNVNPYQSPFWMIVIFYFSFFLFWLSLFGLVGFYLKVLSTNREIIFAHLVPTLRQAALVGLLFTGWLFLLQLRVINWWVALLLAMAVLMVELSFRKSKTNFSSRIK